jgi:putative SOS response-associated peptidase YedK
MNMSDTPHCKPSTNLHRVLAAQIHDRMPAFLTERQFAPWLSGEAGAGRLKPAPNDYLQRWPVSKRVNSSKADAEDATLIEKVELIAP